MRTLYEFKDGTTYHSLTRQEAISFFKDNREVFGLDVSNETEALIETLEDFERFESFGLES